LSRDDYKKAWKGTSDQNEFAHQLGSINPAFQTVEAIKQRLVQNNIFFIAGRSVEAEQAMYFSSISERGLMVLLEMRAREPVQSVTLACKTESALAAPLFIQAVSFLLATTH
jgi:hypothetical protein